MRKLIGFDCLNSAILVEVTKGWDGRYCNQIVAPKKVWQSLNIDVPKEHMFGNTGVIITKKEKIKTIFEMVLEKNISWTWEGIGIAGARPHHNSDIRVILQEEELG